MSDLPAPKKHRRFISCGRAMTQQFIGLKHCKYGMSWHKDLGYFEREQGMVFALEKRDGKQALVIRR